MNALQQEPVAEAIAGPDSSPSPLARYVPLAVWIIVGLTLLLVPLRIISHGFLPVGDARRHVAKAFTEKSYRDIIVLQSGYSMDHSPGWEWLLKKLQRATGWNQDALASASIVITMLSVFLVALPYLKRPEAWLAALLIETIAMPELMGRFAQARPYLITEAVLIAVLFSWSREDQRTPSKWKLALTCLGIGVSVWIHGAWYLWCLPIGAFLLARRWRAGAWLTACWLVGTLAGAALTGKPIEFLKEGLFIGLAVGQQHAAAWMLVWEFRPGDGQFLTVLVVAIVALFRRQTAPSLNPFSGPVFWLAVLGWILSFKAIRFWEDWGVAALLVWLALQLQDVMTAAWDAAASKRLMACALLAVPLFLHTSNDLDRRYSKFEALVGFDASGAKKGRVDCRVFADGKELYASPDLRADAPPVHLSLPVAGADELKLVVDFGPDEDTGDRVIWGNARLYRYAAAAAAGTTSDAAANRSKTTTAASRP